MGLISHTKLAVGKMYIPRPGDRPTCNGHETRRVNPEYLEQNPRMQDAEARRRAQIEDNLRTAISLYIHGRTDHKKIQAQASSCYRSQELDTT
eukprot:6205636-Pleurochrysis_carterae.AAC.4